MTLMTHERRQKAPFRQEVLQLTLLGGDDVHGDVEALDPRRRDEGRRGSSSAEGSDGARRRVVKLRWKKATKI